MSLYPTLPKRLIVCCDGTWQDVNSGLESVVPSNVVRFGRALKTNGAITQLVYYQQGLGTGITDWGNIKAGVTGAGIEENIRSAYTFIAQNYSQGDEICLFGFSRGAYTARCIGGLITTIGLLTKKGISYLPIIYKDLQNSPIELYADYVNKRKPLPFLDQITRDVNNPLYVATLEKEHLTRWSDVQIKVIGVWDTVGQLGIPDLDLHISAVHSKEMMFQDTRLNPKVENAFQALSLDEHRSEFIPCVWENVLEPRTNLKQCWFPGVHSNVGGHYEYRDQGLANITLFWMIEQCSHLLDFDPDAPKQIHEESLLHDLPIRLSKSFFSDQYAPEPDHGLLGKYRPGWAMSLIYNSYSWYYAILNRSLIRTPGQYRRTDPETMKPTALLENTNERFHSSVRVRLQKGGLSTSGQGPWSPPALVKNHWTVQETDRQGCFRWVQKQENTTELSLPEAPLTGYELEYQNLVNASVKSMA